MFSISHITAPLPSDDFLHRYWTHRAVHLRDPGRNFEQYFGWDALNALLNSGALRYPNAALSRETGPIPPAEYTHDGGELVDVLSAMRLYREGASLSIRGADWFWPPLRGLVTGLKDTFFESVHTNVYLSPANIQGRHCHYDLEEVLVFQIEGQKRWRVYRPSIDYPVEPWRLEDVPGVDVEPYLDVVLSKGDVLYVPRGHWHYAVAHDSQSLHVTAGIVYRKGDAFLDWLAPQLRGLPEWRQNVPVLGPPSLDGSLPDAPQLRTWVSRLRQTLIDKLSEPDLLERFAADMFTASSPVVRVQLPESGERVPFAAERYVFQRPAGQRHVISGRETPIRLKVAGLEMELEDVDPGLLAFILGSSPFTLEDIERRAPGVPRGTLSEMLETLVGANLLEAAPKA